MRGYQVVAVVFVWLVYILHLDVAAWFGSSVAVRFGSQYGFQVELALRCVKREPVLPQGERAVERKFDL
jgi:hypothetical protein